MSLEHGLALLGIAATVFSAVAAIISGMNQSSITSLDRRILAVETILIKQGVRYGR